MEEGSSDYLKRFGGDRFSGHVLPFGCLADYFPTPTRPQRTRKVVDNDVVLRDGKEYAAPGEDEFQFQCDDLPDYEELFDDPEGGDPSRESSTNHPSRNDGDEFDDDDQLISPSPAPAELPLMKRGASFLPLASTSKPGIFLGYHHEMGSKWNGDYLVAGLEDFKQNAKRPSVHQLKRVYCAPKE